ncbi:MAG: aldehyde dehydrogenase family protein, partial [Spirochaetota bacterium]
MNQLHADSWINGTSVPGGNGSIAVIDPGSGETIGETARASEADVDLAVENARTAFRASEWRSMPPHLRGRLMTDLARRVDAERDRLALLLSRENGKALSTARDEIRTVVRYFEYYSGWSDKAGGRVVPAPEDSFAYVIREPLGVVAHVVPWNYPVDIFARGVAPCLAVGNTVVVKPDERTPFTTLEIARLASEVGFPPGVINVVNGIGSEVGAALAAHSGIDGLAFCGSVATGRSVLKAAADQLVPVVSLELGGKSAQLVFPDADLSRAARGAAGGICYNTGQSCGARSRLIVHESIADRMAEETAAAMAGIEVGYGPDDPGMGALASPEQLARVMGFIDSARSEGAELREGGTVAEVRGREGSYVRPTLFTNVRRKMTIAQEEVFGPVVSMLTFSSEEEAIEIANDSRYGISGEIWTPDARLQQRAIAALNVSHVSVNGTGGFGIELPFGGVKESGIGREGGLEGVLQYSR